MKSIVLCILATVVLAAIALGSPHTTMPAAASNTTGIARLRVAALEQNAGQSPAQVASAFRQEIAYQAALLSDRQLVQRAIAFPDSAMRYTAWFKGLSDAAAAERYILAHLRVKVLGDSGEITVFMDAQVAPTDACVILIDLANEHVRQQEKLMWNQRFAATEKLYFTKRGLEGEARDLTHERQELRAKTLRTTNEERRLLDVSERLEVLHTELTEVNDKLDDNSLPTRPIVWVEKPGTK